MEIVSKTVTLSHSNIPENFFNHIKLKIQKRNHTRNFQKDFRFSKKNFTFKSGESNKTISIKQCEPPKVEYKRIQNKAKIIEISFSEDCEKYYRKRIPYLIFTSLKSTIQKDLIGPISALNQAFQKLHKSYVVFTRIPKIHTILIEVSISGLILASATVKAKDKKQAKAIVAEAVIKRLFPQLDGYLKEYHEKTAENPDGFGEDSLFDFETEASASNDEENPINDSLASLILLCSMLGSEPKRLKNMDFDKNCENKENSIKSFDGFDNETKTDRIHHQSLNITQLGIQPTSEIDDLQKLKTALDHMFSNEFFGISRDKQWELLLKCLKQEEHNINIITTKDNDGLLLSFEISHLQGKIICQIEPKEPGAAKQKLIHEMLAFTFTK